MALKTSAPRKGVAGRANGADGLDTIPLRYGDDPYVWACWLYYEDGMTQGEIAEAMGVSRATVNSYLAEAREKGIVNISIEPARLASGSIIPRSRRPSRRSSADAWSPTRPTDIGRERSSPPTSRPSPTTAPSRWPASRS